MTTEKPSITNKILLIQLNISQWTARKHDKKATRVVTDQLSPLCSDSGRFNKELLPRDTRLKAISKLASAVRIMYYDNTLPWGCEGMQLLPSANYLAFVDKFRPMRDTWQHEVDMFVRDYSHSKDRAQITLGHLYNAADYPAESSVADKFSMQITVNPVPAADFWVSSIEGELQNLQADVEARLEKSQKIAMKECWTRLYDKVSHMAERLSDPDAIFRDSMVTSMQDLCGVLKHLNFTDDPDLKNMQEEVYSTLASQSPDVLRNNTVVRSNTRADATDIMRRMNAFMGDAE